MLRVCITPYHICQGSHLRGTAADLRHTPVCRCQQRIHRAATDTSVNAHAQMRPRVRVRVCAPVIRTGAIRPIYTQLQNWLIAVWSTGLPEILKPVLFPDMVPAFSLTLLLPAVIPDLPVCCQNLPVTPLRSCLLFEPDLPVCCQNLPVTRLCSCLLLYLIRLSIVVI